VTILGFIAFVTGVLGVWLTIREKIACWPMALTSVTASAIEFYEARLYGDMALQVFYFFAGVYGWVYWQQNLKKEFFVTRVPKKIWPALFAGTLFLSVACHLVLKRFGGDRPLFDGILTAASLAATYMMTRKWLENWAAWVVIDAAYVVLYALKDMWTYSLLYAFFTAVAAWGYFRWKRTALSV
jgi:nicotinamide mononucleotide transporter